MENDIHKTISRLDILIGDGPAPCYFNNPASKEDIAAFEQRTGLKLSDSYKVFLEFTNGGMIISEEMKGLLKQENGLETVKWNANYLYSLEEVEKQYREMESWNFGIPAQNISRYPFIPFCHTKDGEHLVFIHLGDDENESEILDAFHEESPESWGLVAKDFNEFLDHYISAYGYPDVFGDVSKGSALDLIEPLMVNEGDEPSPEQEIAHANNELKINPDDHWQLMVRGLAYADKGMTEKALRDFNRAIELESTDPFYYFSRGRLYNDAGKNRPALIDFDTAVKLDPDSLLYLNFRAIAFVEMNKPEAALEDVNKVIEKDDTDKLAYLIREDIYRTAGEIEKADADSRKIDELNENEEA